MTDYRSQLILSIILGLSLCGGAVAAKLYRWVDSQGKVHYSDKVPPEEASHARSELDQQGIETRRVDAAKTPEQIAQEKELKRLRIEKQKLIEAQQEKDNVLLRTFRSEDDIVMTRDGKVTAIDVQIQVVRSNISRLKAKLADLQKKAAMLERQGKAISPLFLKDIENTRISLKQSYEALIHEEQEKELTRERFNQDLAHFRKLKRLEGEHLPETVENEKRLFTSLLETVVICNNSQACERAWKMAEAYVRTHTTTRMQMLSDSIIMTATPIKDSDISLTVSRITEEGVSGAKLFLDLQCKNSPIGIDLCHSTKVDSIRLDFRQSVESGTP
ncbi:MAG: DUF4124 domain-containing protein [Gammaproteobacteria bacterium]|nr:DUF4124 domain-containing protein [Gammaproteobacteria bacterium]